MSLLLSSALQDLRYAKTEKEVTDALRTILSECGQEGRWSWQILMFLGMTYDDAQTDMRGGE